MCHCTDASLYCRVAVLLHSTEAVHDNPLVKDSGVAGNALPPRKELRPLNASELGRPPSGAYLGGWVGGWVLVYVRRCTHEFVYVYDRKEAPVELVLLVSPFASALLSGHMPSVSPRLLSSALS